MIKDVYRKMVKDGFTTIDLKSSCECIPYPITFGHELSCDDGTRQKVQLVLDEWKGKKAVLLWSFMGGKYVEDLVAYLSENQTWWENLMSDAVMERAHSIMEDIVIGGRESIEKRINTEGIENIHSLVLTENYIKETMRLPYSCAISFYGEVIAGVEEIEKYCLNQKETSSPYILKRIRDISLERGEEEERETVKCVSYLICKDVKTAGAWIKEFVGIEKASIYNDDIPDSWHRPPMVCYAEGERYMLLDYREGYEG